MALLRSLVGLLLAVGWFASLVCAWVPGASDASVAVTPDNQLHFRIVVGVWDLSTNHNITEYPYALIGMPVDLSKGWTPNAFQHCSSMPSSNFTDPSNTVSLLSLPHNTQHWNVSACYGNAQCDGVWPSGVVFEGFFSAQALLQCMSVSGGEHALSEADGMITGYGDLFALSMDIATGNLTRSMNWEYGLQVKVDGSVSAWMGSKRVVAFSPPDTRQLLRFAGPYSKGGTGIVDHGLFNGEVSFTAQTVVYSYLASQELRLSNPVVHSSVSGVVWALISPPAAPCQEQTAAAGFQQCTQQWHFASVGARKRSSLVDSQWSANFTVDFVHSTVSSSSSSSRSVTQWVLAAPLNISSMDTLKTTSGEVVVPDQSVVRKTEYKTNTGLVIGLAVGVGSILVVLISVLLVRQTRLMKRSKKQNSGLTVTQSLVKETDSAGGRTTARSDGVSASAVTSLLRSSALSG